MSVTPRHIAIIEHAREIARNDLGRTDDKAVIEVLAHMIAGTIGGVCSGFLRFPPDKIPTLRLDDQDAVE